MVNVLFCLNLKNLNFIDNPINQIIMQTNKWSIAALDGLLLALITIAATLIQTVFEQQMHMFKTKTHSIEHRIVRIHQPHVRSIVIPNE